MTKEEELKSVLFLVRTTLEQCKAENEKLIKGMGFYANEDWRTVAMTDRGERARQILREVL